MPYPRPLTSFDPVDSLIMETVAARTLMESVRMGLFDHLSGGPRTAKDLAETLGFKPDPLEALLDLLAACDILEITGQGYANTPMADEFLVNASPLSQNKYLELQSWFNDSLLNDIPGLLRGEETRGDVHFESEWPQPRIMDGTLQHAASGKLQDTVAFIAALPGFESFRSMADIGGNHGQYSMDILDHNPELRSTILDLPPVAEAARTRCAAKGYGDRIQCQPFDLKKDELPADTYDLVLASNVLYCAQGILEQVLARVHAGLKPGGFFASHHFVGQSGPATDRFAASMELLTRLSGYQTHFLAREELETALANTGFADFSHILTGPDKRSLLVVGRKTP